LNQGGREYPTYNKKIRKINWIGHILRSNCLLKHVTVGKMEIGKDGSDGETKKKM
jgi:hypothetical protein